MNWLKHKIKNLIIAVLGIALVLAWWTIRKPAQDTNYQVTESKIPETFFEGGPRTLTIQAMSTTNSVMSVSLNTPNPNSLAEESRSQEATEKMKIGIHTWTIHFPANTTSGTLELNSMDPKVGDNMNWTITLDDKIIQQDEIALDKPLEPNTALFLHLELENFLSTAPNEAQPRTNPSPEHPNPTSESPQD